MSELKKKINLGPGPAVPSGICWQQIVNVFGKPFEISLIAFETCDSPTQYAFFVASQEKECFHFFRLSEEVRWDLKLSGGSVDQEGLAISLSQWEVFGPRLSAQVRINAYQGLVIEELVRERIDICN